MLNEAIKSAMQYVPAKERPAIQAQICEGCCHCHLEDSRKPSACISCEYGSEFILADEYRRPETMYRELATKVRNQYKSFQKWQRQISNEPESDAKYGRMELMAKVLDRYREMTNWWDGYEAKMVRREKQRQAEAKGAEKKKRKEEAQKAADAKIEEAIAPHVQEWNTSCRYYCQDEYGRSCSCGMDMTFCSKKCAFATNAPGSTYAHDASVTMNHRRMKDRWD